MSRMFKSHEEQIETAFTYHRPDADAVQRLGVVRIEAKRLAGVIDAFVPAGREKATALTKLEEAVMWANAGIVRHGEEADG